MHVLWVNVFPRHRYVEPLANVWHRNFASFCYQCWQGTDRVLSELLHEIVKTYLKAEEEAWIVKGAKYELLTVHDAVHFRGIVNARFDPWTSRN
jgi:molybdopterin-guanine dinucleotide biosynthesis protein A